MTTVTDPQHGLSLGGLSIVAGGDPVTHPGGFTTALIAEGTNFGKSDPVLRAVVTLLRAGAKQIIDYWSSKPVTLRVEVVAETIDQLNAGEKALAAVVGKESELRWQPSAPGAPVTVFDVETSSMAFAFDDLSELRLTRYYDVTISAFPWPRSATKTITAAVTAVAPSVVDSGSSTTNWAAVSPAGATLSVVSGALTSTYNPNVVSSGFYGTTVTRTFPGTLNTTTSKFIAVDWKTSLATVHGARTPTSFGNMTEVRREPAGTFTRSWYRLADGINSIASLTFGVIHPANAAASATLSIDQVLLANALPASGTTRQKISGVFPGGSVTAEGDVIIQHATAGLGQTIAYSHKATNGYSPPLRQWRVNGVAPTGDATTVSGARNLISPTSTDYRIPVTAMPKGDVHLWARLRATTTNGLKTISWSVSSWMNSTILDYDLRFATFTFPVVNTWYLVPLGRTTLPSTPIGAAGYIETRLQEGAATGVEVDEAWLFAMDEGRLTVVDCGTGTGVSGGISNRLKITAPSREEPNGAIFVANAADFSDAYTPSSDLILCDQVGHMFDPDGASILTVTSGTTDAAVSFEHFERWHSNAGS